MEYLQAWRRPTKCAHACRKLDGAISGKRRVSPFLNT